MKKAFNRMRMWHKDYCENEIDMPSSISDSASPCHTNVLEKA